MKKIYNSPEVIVVSLHANRAVLEATSLTLNGDIELTGDEILTRENTVISGRNVWDDEW